MQAVQMTVTGWDKAAVIIAGIAAFLSLGAIIVALWVADWRHRLRSPRLSLRLADSVITQTHVVVSDQTGAIGLGPKMIYTRLLVENAEGKDDAEDVQLIVENYSPVNPAPGRGVAAQTQHLRMPLAWTHSSPTATLATVAAGYGRLVDLLTVEAGKPFLMLQVRPEPAGDEHYLRMPQAPVPAEWRLDVVLLARRVPHRRFRIRITYDGRWDVDRAPQDHLMVELH